MKLTAENVYQTFVDCLYPDNEIENMPEDKAPEGAIVIRGITFMAGFKPENVEKHKEDIKSLLSELPDTFMHDKGGGYSFLGACETKDGSQWGEHRNMEQLFLMGEAAGFVRLCLPREMWPALPGGVPYYAVNLDGFPKENKQAS